MDEVIGAGDAHFVERAQARLKMFIESANMMVVATHSLDILRQWCNTAILLSQGRIVAQGDVETVIAAYRRETAGA
jgi:ABC-2 type transport system ATP-binding protein/lipopolysaccharide transport system ATP-binding protein